MAEEAAKSPVLKNAPAYMNNAIFSSLHRSSTYRKDVKDKLFMRKSTK